jgi:hypothetical protein
MHVFDTVNQSIVRPSNVELKAALKSRGDEVRRLVDCETMYVCARTHAAKKTRDFALSTRVPPETSFLRPTIFLHNLLPNGTIVYCVKMLPFTEPFPFMRLPREIRDRKFGPCMGSGLSEAWTPHERSTQ